jgi:hypothetical protein
MNAPAQRAPRWLLWTFGAVVAAAGGGFIFKLVEFSQTLRASPEVSFALLPIVTYLTVAAGFFCLLLWAALGRHFRDLEGPKHFMLENERALDAAAPLPERPRS